MSKSCSIYMPPCQCKKIITKHKHTSSYVIKHNKFIFFLKHSKSFINMVSDFIHQNTWRTTKIYNWVQTWIIWYRYILVHVHVCHDQSTYLRQLGRDKKQIFSIMSDKGQGYEMWSSESKSCIRLHNKPMFCILIKTLYNLKTNTLNALFATIIGIRWYGSIISE